MLKKIIRKRTLNIRKLKFDSKYKINFIDLLEILKQEKIQKGIIGGYYPVNYEIDDLDILKKFEKKNTKFHYH